jgi:hypothetical protein
MLWMAPAVATVKQTTRVAGLYASTYRPRATRMNRGEGPETFEHSACLTEDHATGSPINTSTALWTSLARIGPPRSVITWTTARRTQPGRRDRCRHDRCSRTSPFARTSASFPTTRRNRPCKSWFDSAPTTSTSGEESSANRTKGYAKTSDHRGRTRRHMGVPTRSSSPGLEGS